MVYDYFSAFLHFCFLYQYKIVGPFPVGDKQNKLHGMDTQILIDALAVIMGHEEKELCKPGNLALVLILDTATTILGSKEKVRIDCSKFIILNLVGKNVITVL